MRANSFSTMGIARASARHPWRTLGLWVLAFVVVSVLANGVGGKLTNDIKLTNEPESQRAADLLESRLRGPDPLSETVVVRNPDATVDDPAFQAVVQRVTSDLLALSGAVSAAVNYYDATQQGLSTSDSMVSADRHTTIIAVTLVGDHKDVTKYSKDYVDTIERQSGDGYQVLSVGSASGDEEYGKVAERDLGRAELFGLPVALIVLVIVFGALLAAGLPLALGLVTIAVAAGLATIAGRAIDMNYQVTTIITMIGLAVGIDYSLFVVERYREERRRGAEKVDAIVLAGGTAGKAVFFSGMTVVIALLGLFIIPVSVFQSFGVGAGLAVLVAVAATQTFIPALLSLLGDRINWPRRKHFAALAAPSVRDGEHVHLGVWGNLTRVVMRRPLVAAALAIGVLLLAAAPVTKLQTGQAGIDTLPDSDVKTAYQILHDEFYVGMITPVEIAVDGNVSDPLVATGIDHLVTALAGDPLYGPATVEANTAGDLTLVSAPLGTDANSDAAYDAIKRLRHETVPSAFNGTPARAYVGGATATTADFNSILSEYMPIVFAFVLGLSFLLLMVAFRSVVVPLTAIAMNLLSVGAAYGLLVLVFQKGHGAGLFGFIESPTIEAWIPLFLFCILFGLSMDYHVFLLSRIRERFDQTGDNAVAVAHGLQATARIITGAALIMVAVFSAFASGDMVTIQQMGFGLAVAVFLDATIVRMLLVPSIMRLLGDRNWYLPSWLSWLPHVTIDAATPTPQAPAACPNPEPAIAD